MKTFINILFYVSFVILLIANLYQQDVIKTQRETLTKVIPTLQMCEQVAKNLGLCEIQLMVCGCDVPGQPEEQTNGPEGREI